MEQLYKHLYDLFVIDLMERNIGYDINYSRIDNMIDIINAIDYIQHGFPVKNEIRKIINIYAK